VSGDLEDFVAQIDLPSCRQITIGLFNCVLFEIPRFCQLIPRLDALSSPAYAFITHSLNFVDVHFYQEGKRSSMNCISKTSCRRLDGQLLFVTQITSQLSHLLSSVHSLGICRGFGLPTGEEDVDPTQWLDLFQPFTHVTRVYIRVGEFVSGIVRALVAEDVAADVLPELTSLHVNGYLNFRSTSPSAASTAEQFVARRKLSGRTVALSFS
jgi:hypothetical protein